MRQSRLFTKTRRQAPTDEVAKNAQLLTRAGFVHKEMAGVYSFLPLGLRVLTKIMKVIREEMEAIGGVEVSLSALQDKELWKKTDRWDDSKVDNWFKTTFKTGGEAGLGVTHEEPLTRIMCDHLTSYRDLPVYVYQFQTKFRNELRAKSGILRGKEFLMKDLYSFSRSEEEHNDFYAQARKAYLNIFDRLGLGDHTYVTFASGGVFTDFSEEFQTVCEAGEDTIYLDEGKKLAVNKEVYNDETLTKLGLSRNELKEMKAIEVGNIFSLGTRFSEALGLRYTDTDGSAKPVVMGSYGIGPARVMGAIVEVLSDEKGMVWPKETAPYSVHLITLVPDVVIGAYADALYDELTAAGIDVLYDDRDLRAGEKLADSDLIGIPTRIVVGKETIDSGKLEVIDRSSGETRHISRDDIVSILG